MDLPAGYLETLTSRGYAVDGSRFLTRRPDRLAVGLRAPSGERAIGKLYLDGTGEVALRNMEALWDSAFGVRRDPPGLARPIEYIGEIGVLVMERLDGRPLAELDYLADEALDGSAALLASLHRCDAVLSSVPRTPRRIVTSLRRKQSRISQLAPEHAAGFATAVDAVEAAQPDGGQLVPCHGDFSPRNVLAGAGRYAIIDWDRLKLSDPARDVAHFGAWCWLYSLHRRRVHDWSALERFAAAYALRRQDSTLERRLDFHLAAVLLRMVASRIELWREESYLVPVLIGEAMRRAT